jgi:hypothetical protein
MGSEAKLRVLGKDGRYRAEITQSLTLIFEKTAKGVLVTELDKNVGVLDQQYINGADINNVLMSRLQEGFLITEMQEMPKTTIEKECGKCGTRLIRELEFAPARALEAVPVVPIFRCGRCGMRFYSMTKEYLSKLVERNSGLFADSEIAELNADREKGINTLNEYIIRIFASKKINRI